MSEANMDALRARYGECSAQYTDLTHALSEKQEQVNHLESWILDAANRPVQSDHPEGLVLDLLMNPLNPPVDGGDPIKFESRQEEFEKAVGELQQLQDRLADISNERKSLRSDITGLDAKAENEFIAEDLAEMGEFPNQAEWVREGLTPEDCGSLTDEKITQEATKVTDHYFPDLDPEERGSRIEEGEEAIRLASGNPTEQDIHDESCRITDKYFPDLDPDKREEKIQEGDEIMKEARAYEPSGDDSEFGVMPESTPSELPDPMDFPSEPPLGALPDPMELPAPPPELPPELPPEPPPELPPEPPPELPPM